MKTKILAGALLACFAGAASAGTEGSSSTFYGLNSGAVSDPHAGFNTFLGYATGMAALPAASHNTFVGWSAGWTNTSGIENTFIGSKAGVANSVGSFNTILGYFAGSWNTTGSLNTFIGHSAGRWNSWGSLNTYLGTEAGASSNGTGNVFLGHRAGYSELGSERLYIDNCYYSAGQMCDRPLIYGEFDNRLVDIDGVLAVTANRTAGHARSQLHFSVTGADEGGWITSAGANNFFTSSGARYDANVGGWIQRSADGNAVIAGSGGVGFRVLTSSGGAVGSVVEPVSRLHIDYAGLMGVNTAPEAGRAINTSTGAYLSSGGVWTNASSRALKEDIERLDGGEAMRAFEKLEPVRFRYKDEAGTHVGFIAEDVPALVATEDRKGLSAMDVVAVLTKVVQEKSRVIERQEAEIAAQSSRLAAMEARLEALAAEVQRKH